MNSNKYICENKTAAKLAVHSRSKKIQKPASPAKKSAASSYNTFNSSEKRAILMDLKKSLSKIRSLQANCSSEELLQVLSKVHKNDFNTMLRASLSNHFPTFENTTEGLRIWRRRVKEWLKALDKPEGRGNLLVPSEKLEEFKMLLICALKSFAYRSLKQLRQALYHIFEQIGKPLNDKNTCSKHWWYDFLKANPEVRNVWESLPKRAGSGQEGSEEDTEEWNSTENFTSSPQTPYNNTESFMNNFDITCVEQESNESNYYPEETLVSFPVVELNENFEINFFEKQKSVSRVPSVSWEKFLAQGSQERLSPFNFEEQLKTFESYLNKNAFEF